MVSRKKEPIKHRLDQELKYIQFSKQQQVLNKIHSSTWKQRIRSLWNKEIEVPLLPLSIVFITLLISIGTLESITDTESSENVRVEIGGYIYWKDNLERVVMKNES